MQTAVISNSNPIFIHAVAGTDDDMDMTPTEAARIMQSAHDYLYASRRINHHFQGNNRDYDAHNMAHTLLFFARVEAEKQIN